MNRLGTCLYCPAEIPETLLVCREHWARVPRPLRRRSTRAFKRWHRRWRDPRVVTELLNARAAIRRLVEVMA